MAFQLIPKSKIKEALWSGGVTKELFIYPQGASYQERHFDFRLSTAQIKEKASTFTNLNYHRVLMVLGAPILLKRGEKEAMLEPFTPLFFHGQESVQSRGETVDFNVMYQDHYEVHVERWQEGTDFFSGPLADFYFLYVFEGRAEVEIGKTKTSLCAGDFLALYEKESILGLSTQKKEDVLIISKIYRKSIKNEY